MAVSEREQSSAQRRYLEGYIREDLANKMVFIGGPRQVGKTTLSLKFIQNSKQYLNYDDLEDRELIKTHKINPQLKTVILDEVHKYFRWRTLLKGLYDKYRATLKIIVTGSARLDIFRKGGDSLLGRYHYYRLHPFTLPEVDPKLSMKVLEDLLQYGGFPEPFLLKDSRNHRKNHRRWVRERKARVLYQDIRDLGSVKELSHLELLVDALESKVGSPISLNGIAEDLEVSPNTIKQWLLLLEQVYYSFRISPYGSPKFKAIKKSQKLYLWDYSEVEDLGARFENLVASTLLKYCHFLEDTQGYKMELRYIRDAEGREVDFVVIQNKKPLFAVECKTGEKAISKNLYYFRERTPIPRFYQVHLGTQEYMDQNIYVLPFTRFCKIENMV